MADLDAELLALAGGDSSDEGSVTSPARHKSSSPTTSHKGSSPAPMARKGTAKPSRKPRRRRDYSDDEDEQSVASERSASMSQSDSEAEYDPTEEKPMYPYEKLYHSAQDKADILAKPEIEREEILAQRGEQVERHEQDLQLKRLLQAREKETAKAEARKRKASAADLDGDPRKSSRQRTKVGGGKAGEANSAIAAYKRQREEQKLRGQQLKERAANRRADSPSLDYSDGDAEAESDNDDYDRRYHHKRSPTPVKDDPPAELADIQRIRVGRDNFAQVLWTPGFEDTITNCYVRVCLGPGRQPGMMEYRLCSVKGFQEGRPYAITGQNGKSFVTDRYLIAAHGKATRPWSFLECSNSRFTDDEWRRYRLTMANDDIPMPTRGRINSKLDQINKLINHRLNDVEISAKLKKQNDMIDKVNRTSEKKALKEQISEAAARGDDKLVAELEDRLANIVPMKLAMNTTLNNALSQKSKQEADRLAELNMRNIQATAQAVAKANKDQRAKYKKRYVEKGKLNVDDDLFGSGSDISRAGTPVNGGNKHLQMDMPSRAATPSRLGQENGKSVNGNDTPRSSTPAALHTGHESKKGLPVIKKSKREDEVLQGLDLGIDIEI